VSPSEARLEVRSGPIAGSPLIADYLAGAPALAPFFGGDPFDADSFRRKADEVARRLDGPARRRAGGSIRPTSAAAAARLERVLDGDGYVVTTGQQTGLFGGPLYTVHKILTAMALAERLEALLGVPVLALFWSAAEDHDFDEVAATRLTDTAGELVRLSLSAPSDAPPVAMARRTLGDGVLPLLDALPALLPATGAAERWLARLRDAYRPEATVAAAFEAWIAALFEGRDLLITSAADPVLKAASVPVLAREAEHALAHAELVAEQSARLERLGYHAQVPPAAGVSNLQYEDGQGRERLVRDARGWLLRRTRRRLDDSALTAALAAEPWRISPNVLLRPVVESSVFPTLAYVGGPAEISYFAQIGGLFRAHGMEPPVAYPRRSVLLIEPGIRRALDRLGLEPGELATPLETLARQRARASLPPEAGDALAALRNHTVEAWSRMAEAAALVDPTLLEAMRSERRAALERVDEAERRLLRHARRRADVDEARLRRAATALHPDGTPQERALGILPFLARWDGALLDAIAAALELPSLDAAGSKRRARRGEPGAAPASPPCPTPPCP
jgi:bacillithiol synthase